VTEIGLRILIALAEGESHGYSIMREIAAQSNGAVKLYPGTLYANIRKLLEEGLIEELDERPDEDDERRRYYRLTKRGRASALAEISRLQEIVHSARRLAARSGK